MTYKWHTSTYGWHTNPWHTNEIRVTYGWHVVQKKNKFTFLKLFDNSLSNFWFVKEFLACNSCFGLFNKIKKGFGINFWCTFSAWFFHKNVPYLIIYQLSLKVTSFLQDIKQNTLLRSYLDNWWRHKP